MQHKRSLVTITLTAIVAAACGGGGTSSAAPTGAAPTTAPVATASGPDKLVIGFVPSREASALVETIKPIADYLSEQLGIPVEGYVSTDYTAMVTALKTGQAQVAALAPFTIVQAVDEANAVLILQSERNGSGTYHTQFMTNNPDKYCTVSPAVENERTSEINPGTFLNCNGTERGATDSPKGPIGTEALKNITPGTTVSFVEESSASGYIFPITILKNAGIDVDTGIEKSFAGGHDASAIAVCGGQAEVGVSFDDARSEATSECDLQGKVVVFAYGDEIPNDGIVVSGDLPADFQDKIKQALISYSETPDGATVLKTVYNITAFAEPNVDALQIVRDAAAAVPQN
ncbi:MAG TPA: phosphate/phosphite/phosphonate ABC transporter substrate-binding protein [Candidatus Limnocylindrales bacterium]|nr:phosphate/phosphite/phosphonate ABC transporter substrate-binding protein [Candidatus Limnocylindrales bacterium]